MLPVEISTGNKIFWEPWPSAFLCWPKHVCSIFIREDIDPHTSLNHLFSRRHCSLAWKWRCWNICHSMWAQLAPYIHFKTCRLFTILLWFKTNVVVFQYNELSSFKFTEEFGILAYKHRGCTSCTSPRCRFRIDALEMVKSVFFCSRHWGDFPWSQSSRISFLVDFQIRNIYLNFEN